MTNKPIKISENCWKHINKNNVFYTKRSDLKSELHREDGPAIEYINGNKSWLINNKLHRENGPAIECADGHKEWYYNGTYIDANSQKEFELYIKNLIFI